MRSTCGLFAIVFFVTTSMASQPADDATLPLAERVFVASKVYSLTQVFFAHWEGAPGLDLDAAYREYLSKIVTTDERRQFDLATMEFVAKLHNGHTDFWDPWVIEHYGWPRLFNAMYFDGQWVVTRSSLPDLKSGDVVVSIDNQSFDQFFAESRRYLSGSNESQLRKRLFSSNSPLPAKFLLRLADGRTVHVGPERSNPTVTKTPEITVGRWIRDGMLAYIKIPSFDDPEFQKNAIEFIQKFHNSKALIVDVRGNGGGSTPGDLIRCLMDRPWNHWVETTPADFGTMKLDMNNDPGFHLDYRFEYPTEKPGKTAYAGRLLILTDSDCTSACEDFVMPFKQNGRATIVGEETFGSSGQAYFYKFENGMIFRISTKREYFPDGSGFEGVGIRPNVEIYPRAEDLRSGRDVVLEKASSLALEQR